METGGLIVGLMAVGLLLILVMLVGGIGGMLYLWLKQGGGVKFYPTRIDSHPRGGEILPQPDEQLDKDSQDSVQPQLSEEELLADLNDWERALWDKQCQAYAMLHDGRNPRMTAYMRAQLRRAALRRP